MYGFRESVASCVSTDFGLNGTLFGLMLEFFWVKFFKTGREGVLDGNL
jgi:hypothetical protein